ncbi:hypothetical protein SNEBB_009107 [Seison nebaliae]|nr:hypothetical protein SNEBB_009107 [Seison nebaliae]
MNILIVFLFFLTHIPLFESLQGWILINFDSGAASTIKEALSSKSIIISIETPTKTFNVYPEKQFYRLYYTKNTFIEMCMGNFDVSDAVLDQIIFHTINQTENIFVSSIIIVIYDDKIPEIKSTYVVIINDKVRKKLQNSQKIILPFMKRTMYPDISANYTTTFPLRITTSTMPIIDNSFHQMELRKRAIQDICVSLKGVSGNMCASHQIPILYRHPIIPNDIIRMHFASTKSSISPPLVFTTTTIPFKTGENEYTDIRPLEEINFFLRTNLIVLFYGATTSHKKNHNIYQTYKIPLYATELGIRKMFKNYLAGAAILLSWEDCQQIQNNKETMIISKIFISKNKNGSYIKGKYKYFNKTSLIKYFPATIPSSVAIYLILAIFAGILVVTFLLTRQIQVYKINRRLKEMRIRMMGDTPDSNFHFVL